MSEIEALQENIRKAQEEYDNCGKLSAEIGKLLDNVTQCVNKLSNASDGIANGLIVEGKPADDGRINEINNNIGRSSANIGAITSLISNRMEELTKNIEEWNSQLTELMQNLTKV